MKICDLFENIVITDEDNDELIDSNGDILVFQNKKDALRVARNRAEGSRDDWRADDPSFRYDVTGTATGYDVIKSPMTSISYGKSTPPSKVIHSFNIKEK